MNTSAACALGAAEAVALLRRRAITSEELVCELLKRIAGEDGGLGAFEHVDPDAALAAARRIDALSERPPLAGLPVAVKDIIDTADLPTECGFSGFLGRRPERDAACVARLRAAGGIVLGKTVTTEFAFFRPGKTRNPHDPLRTPGGSSSGSAAAVAARLAPAALGTQTAGSIIRPASYCGVVGFKPTYGVLSLEGISPFAPSLDTLGIFVRSVCDLPLLLGALAPASVSARPRATLPGPPRIALCRTEQWPLADASTQDIVERVTSRLADAGATTAVVEPGPAFVGLAESQRAIMAAEAARTFEPIVREHRGALSPVLLAFIEEGERIERRREEAARRQAATCTAALEELFKSHDALVTPSAAGEAPLGLESTGDPAFNRIWTLLGVPCLSLPAARGPAGMPVGVQLVGARGQDIALLETAAWVEAALGERR